MSTAASDVRMTVHRGRGTWLRFLRGNLVGFLTFGFYEDDTFEPERFDVVVRSAADDRVLARIPAGSHVQEAEAVRQILIQRAEEMPLDAFLADYVRE